MRLAGEETLCLPVRRLAEQGHARVLGLVVVKQRQGAAQHVVEEQTCRRFLRPFFGARRGGLAFPHQHRVTAARVRLVQIALAADDLLPVQVVAPRQDQAPPPLRHFSHNFTTKAYKPNNSIYQHK